MHPLSQRVIDVPDFHKPGILFRDITPLLRSHFADAVAGVESRGFMLAAALAERFGVLIDLGLAAGFRWWDQPARSVIRHG